MRTSTGSDTVIHALLPVYNASNTLPSTLASLRAQTLTRWRCLAVDDGSDDDSALLLDQAAAEDHRIVVLKRPHQGIVAALNAALDALDLPPEAWPRGATSEHLIARVDADDPLHPERFERQRRLLDADPGVDLTSCQCNLFNSAGTPVGTGMRRYMGWANGVLSAEDHRRERYVESPVAHSSVTARPWIFADGYRAGLGWAEDYDLWLGRLNQGARFVKLPQALLRVRDDPHRTSRHDPRCTQEAFIDCKIHHLAQGPLADLERVALWGAGSVGKRWLKALAMAGLQAPVTVDLNPRKIGKTIHGALVVAPDDLPDAMRALDLEFCLVAVGARGARADIRQRMQGLGLTEEMHYLFVA